MKIAIIGAGISGLTAAYYLCRRHEVTVFEANSYLGGHTNTVDVATAAGPVAVDTGFIVFNDTTYPNFRRLLSELQVESQPTSMSFSVRCDRTGLEYRGADLNGLFAQRRNLVSPGFYRLLADLVRFNRQAPSILASEREETVGEFFARESYSPQFYQQYFLPMGSAVWSCPRATFEEFPIRFIVEFYGNHGLLQVKGRPQWQVIRGGSKTYVSRLIRPFVDRIRLNSPVHGVRREPSRVELCVGGDVLAFDHVVFACHSDQALRILGGEATATERGVLSAFPYEANVALLHTDESVLPRCRRAWASWNYHLPAEDTGKATVTYNMNILQGLRTREVYCVTLNAEQRVDPGKVVGRFLYHHPVFNRQRSAAQRRHRELLQQRTSFCGAYWGNGFHEDGVNSALAVCAALGEGQACTVASSKVGYDTSDLLPSSTASVTGST